jgi:PAS domain S-box-containing protein
VSYELDRRERNDAQRELYEVTSDPDRTFEEKLDALFDLGCDRFGLDIGGLAKIDPETDYFEVETVSGDHDHFLPGTEYPLSETYCRSATEDGETAAVTDPVGAGFEGRLCYERFGVRTYLGTHVPVEGGADRTFWFLSTESRETPITEEEQTFLDLMGQWVRHELDRRQRERELRERTEHLSALVETTPACITTVAPDGTLLRMNSPGLEMVGADSVSDVTGGCVYDLIAPEHREKFRKFNERVCRGERGTLEFDIIGLEGTRRHMESHAAPLHRPDGSTVQVALTRDVTEQKEHEERLERKTERLESFASMLAHELRNPVTIGQIYSQQLPAETDSGADSETDSSDSEAVEYVTEAFDRIEDMIDVMLVVTRGSEAVGGSCSVDLADEARAAWDDVDAPDATLDVALDRTIQADETYVRHFFRNLLENAVQHDGADVTVTVGDFPSGFYVADGDGIPPEERDAVFEAGYTTATDGGGTGLGLAFVRELADVYGWDCDVTENEDGGARFEFRNVDRDPSET